MVHSVGTFCRCVHCTYFKGTYNQRIYHGRCSCTGTCILHLVCYFGNLGINLGQKGILTLEQLQEYAATPEVGLFAVLEQYPLGSILSIVAIISLCAFFVTSANSGVFVLSMLTTDGDHNPPNSKKILWGVIQSVMAIGLLMAGGLKPLQTISLAAAFPFIFIMFATCAAFIKALKQEKV